MSGPDDRGTPSPEAERLVAALRKALELYGPLTLAALIGARPDLAAKLERAVDLRERGWRRSAPGPCRGPHCGREVEWWITANEKRCPLDPDTLEPHWATCPDAKQFRKGGA